MIWDTRDVPAPYTFSKSNVSLKISGVYADVRHYSYQYIFICEVPTAGGRRMGGRVLGWTRRR